MQRKILFLGETFRADAITWMNGLKEFGGFEIITWEMKNTKGGFGRLKRFAEYLNAPSAVKKIIKTEKPDMIIAERTTSFGYLAAICGHHPIAIAQQGKTDIWPENSPLVFLKKAMQNKAFREADLLHAWGSIMGNYMRSRGVPESKILQLAKGIDLRKFNFEWPHKPTDKIRAIVTRSLRPEYRHTIILQAFALLDKKGIDFELVLVGDGPLKELLKEEAKELEIADKVEFAGIIPNGQLPALLKAANLYVSMPVSEGVSASLFEAMATGNVPLVTNLTGNAAWIDQGHNGCLIDVDDAEMLSSKIAEVWLDRDWLKMAVQHNLALVKEHANFEKNMGIIAAKYHELIDTNTAKKKV